MKFGFISLFNNQLFTEFKNSQNLKNSVEINQLSSVQNLDRPLLAQKKTHV